MEKEGPTITSPRVILCEGAGDRAFLRHLIEERELPSFYITYPAEGDHTQPGGRDGYTAKLKALRLMRGFDDVTDLIVIADNDDSPQRSFETVCELIEAAPGYTAPNAAEVPVGRNPRLTILMLPGDGLAGQLETLCLEACLDNWPELANCLNAFIQCNPSLATWDRGKQEKMKMRTLISSICSTDPNTSLTHAWSRTEQIIPLQHSCFDGIVNFLRSIGDGQT